MHQIILDEDCATIKLSDISETALIFAKRNNKLVGVVWQEECGWILKISQNTGATGYHATRQDCLKSCLKHDYLFFIEES